MAAASSKYAPGCASDENDGHSRDVISSPWAAKAAPESSGRPNPEDTGELTEQDYAHDENTRQRRVWNARCPRIPGCLFSCPGLAQGVYKDASWNPERVSYPRVQGPGGTRIDRTRQARQAGRNRPLMSFTPGHEAEDLAVVRRVLAGEINAYAILVERHAPGLAALTARHGPPDKAVEIANDTLVRAYENLKSFKGDKPFTHWLRKIAVNQCREYWRACNKRRETSLEPLDPDALSFVQSALDKVSLERFEDFTRGREAAELLEYALAHLKPEDRLVLSLTHLDEYDCAEAAEMLGWSVSKVKVRAHRARLKMREAIEKLLATGGEDARI